MKKHIVIIKTLFFLALLFPVAIFLIQADYELWLKVGCFLGITCVVFLTLTRKLSWVDSFFDLKLFGYSVAILLLINLFFLQDFLRQRQISWADNVTPGGFIALTIGALIGIVYTATKKGKRK